MRPGQPARSRAPRRAKALASRSPDPAKVERAEDVYQAGQTALRRDRFRCQAQGLLPGRCAGGLDPQHVIPRGVRKDLAAVVENIVAVCRGHHRWIDNHPRAAWDAGFHGHGWDDVDAAAARRQQARDNAGGNR